MEQFGSYELLERIATGGMAEVYRARRRGAGEDAAPLVIKRMLPHLAESRLSVERFVREAQLAESLDHPNVVRVLDAGEVEGAVFLAMQFVAGENLAQLRRAARQRRMPIPVRAACAVACGAAAGLEYVHRRADELGRPLGIVHRDVTPSNILVGEDGRVRLLDFGVARVLGVPEIDGSEHAGSAAYMSPEQVAGGEVEPRSDQFALAVVLWELLTGAHLFARATELQTLEAIAACRVRAPSRAAPRVPRALDAVLLRALSREPDRRFPSMAAFRAALEGALEGCGGEAARVEVAELVARLRPRAAKRAAGAASAAATSGAAAALAAAAVAGEAMTAAAPAVARGVVEVHCEPEATVWEGGALLGTTPYRGELAPGRHQLTLINPEQGLEHAFSILVKAGRVVRRSFSFERGEIYLVVHPWAEVWLNGRKLGTTPLPKLSLLEGDYLFTLVNPELGRERIVPITVRPGRLERRTVDLGTD